MMVGSGHWALIILAVVFCCHSVAARSFRSSDLSLLTSRQSDSPVSTCAPLKNHGTHFTVQIGVGSPPQHFDVVADTGSDSVIIPSCACRSKDGKLCSDHCFQLSKNGTSPASASFSLAGRSTDNVTNETKVPIVVLTFGSGVIAAQIGTDVVQVGSAKAVMREGVLLMVKRDLRIFGPFEGILGLGLPKQTDLKTQKFDEIMPPTSLTEPRFRYEMHGFLESVGVSHFTLCFNDDGKDGVLRLGGEEPKNPLGSVGKAHWGLEFNGITVGAADSATSIRASFCDPSQKEPEQDTVCGAIPDSGTTVTMAPAKHLEMLFAHICDLWEPCRIEAQLGKAKSATLQSMLLECGSWMGNSSEGLNVLPELNFHLAGAGGKKQVVTLPGAAYILEMMEDEIQYVRKNLAGVTIEVPMLTGKRRKVCAPAFGEMDYITKRNGPVWILGTPFFYEHQVGYNLKTKPPSISFSSSRCGLCSDDDGAGKEAQAQQQPSSFLLEGSSAAQMSSVTSGSSQRFRRTTPRRLTGPIRLPQIDVNEPL